MRLHCLFTLLVVSAACNCSHRPNPGCRPVAAACASDEDCCSFGCNGGQCSCNPLTGGTCLDHGDCCPGLRCESGSCAAGCRPDTAACSSASDCCSGGCESGACTVRTRCSQQAAGGPTTNGCFNPLP